MKKCKYCNVEVETDKNFCPLCFNRLENVTNQTEEFYSQRKVNETTNKTTKFLAKFFVFLSICVSAICFIINYLTTPKILWSLVVFFSIIYMWILIRHTIMSKETAFKKALLQLISIILLLLFVERLAPDNWLFPYVFPSISMATALVMLLLVFISKKRNEYLFGFSFIFLSLAVGSLLCVLISKTSYSLLNLINLGICTLSFAGIWTFGFNEIKIELSKKWHL